MNGIELQYMLKYMVNYIVRAREVIQYDMLASIRPLMYIA